MPKLALVLFFFRPSSHYSFSIYYYCISSSISGRSVCVSVSVTVEGTEWISHHNHDFRTELRCLHEGVCCLFVEAWLALCLEVLGECGLNWYECITAPCRAVWVKQVTNPSKHCEVLLAVQLPLGHDVLATAQKCKKFLTTFSTLALSKRHINCSIEAWRGSQMQGKNTIYSFCHL